MSDHYSPFLFGTVVGFVIAATFSNVIWQNTVRSYEEMTNICLKIQNKTPIDEDYSLYLEQCKNASKILTGTKK